jgi:hypothetical protein
MTTGFLYHVNEETITVAKTNKYEVIKYLVGEVVIGLLAHPRIIWR